MREQIKSSVMIVEIDGSTIHYAYKDEPSAMYEIRGIAPLDRGCLRNAQGRADENLSASATVQYLTHLHKDRHFRADGKKAKPGSQSTASLKERTLYREKGNR